jgi:hypothetical protein
MYVITEEGQVHEGLALTPEEAEIFKQLGEGPELNAHSENYISQRSACQIAAYLCSNFILVRRKSLEQEPELNSEEPDFVPESQSVLESSEIPQSSDDF